MQRSGRAGVLSRSKSRMSRIIPVRNVGVSSWSSKYARHRLHTHADRPASCQTIVPSILCSTSSGRSSNVGIAAAVCDRVRFLVGLMVLPTTGRPED